MRVLLWTLSFATMRRFADRLCTPVIEKSDPQPIIDSVRSAARLLPICSCLTQAFTGRFLLARGGHAASIHIGVAAGEGKLHAHAWVTLDNRIILGEFAPGEFHELVALDAA